MRPKSRLSIILITKQAHKYLDLCLQSIQKNSIYDNEIIIVCDQPSWQTLKLLQERQMGYYLTNYNHFFMACNFGAKKATREYVGFINDDVYFGPRWDEALEEIVAPDVLACIYNVNHDNGPTFGYNRPIHNLEDFNVNAFEEYCINNRSDNIEDHFWMPLVIKKDIFFDHGGFTYFSAMGHGHEVELENRIKNDYPLNAKVKASHRGFLFHFGSTSNRDDYWDKNDFFKLGFFGCVNCGKIIPNNDPHLDTGTIMNSIKTNGYWLCGECKNKIEIDNNTITKLRHLHAERCWN